MDKQSFSKVVDESLHALRRKLLDAYAEGIPTNSPAESGSNSQQLQQLNSARISQRDPTGSVSPLGYSSKNLPVVVKVDSRASNDVKNDLKESMTVHESEMDVSGHHHPELTPAFEGSEEEGRAIRSRLRLRLGALNDSLVSGKGLHDACVALGLTAYTVEDMNCLLNLLADYIELDFETVENTGEKPKRMSVNSVNTFFFANHASVPIRAGKPVWKWPSLASSRHLQRSASMGAVDMPTRSHFNVVPAMPLMEVFLAKDSDVHRKIFGARYVKQFKAMKEILLAGDTNRLVAELTFVRINDLAAPPEDRSIGVLLEPLVACVIIANGIMIGFQTDPEYRDWDGWIWIETAFALFLIAEIILRMLLMQGRRMFFCGQECAWNYFDMVLAVSGLVDVSVQLVGLDMPDVFATSLLRFCRLIRLVRIVKVFRLKAMKDLRLMVKGLVAGIKTLVLAFTLLFTVLYVISGFATMTFGNDPKTIERGLQRYFITIPDSMFTCFRCFTGECVNDEGQPIHSILKEEFGFVFVFGYVASFMLVSLGIFNVILAVYVDITMKAAKENDLTVEQHSRESIRIARIARELLKKFAAAFRLFQNMDDEEGNSPKTLFNSRSQGFMDAGVLESIHITKELFLMVIQDRRVQGLMDELELPPDRANLFEIIDADGSGTLQLSELVHGLLKIRGEISKSDVVAGLLATKCVQEKVAEVLQENEKNMDALRFEIQGLQMALTREGSCGEPELWDAEEEPPSLPSCSKPSFLQAALKPVDLVDESEVAPPEVAPPTEEVELESEPPEVGHHPEAMG